MYGLAFVACSSSSVDLPRTISGVSRAMCLENGEAREVSNSGAVEQARRLQTRCGALVTYWTRE